METQLDRPKRLIKAALLSGKRMTSAEGNREGNTVDFRKVVSRLKKEGMPISSYWTTTNGHRYKIYFYQNNTLG